MKYLATLIGNIFNVKLIIGEWVYFTGYISDENKMIVSFENNIADLNNIDYALVLSTVTKQEIWD